MFMLLRRVCRRDAYSSSNDDDALWHGMVKVNSEGNGKRVLERLGIPLATSYLQVIPRAPKKAPKKGERERGRGVYTFVGLAL